MTIPDDLVDYATAGRILGVSRVRVQQLCDFGLLERWRIGGHPFVSVRECAERADILVRRKGKHAGLQTD